jgi:hypothetical protein
VARLAGISGRAAVAAFSRAGWQVARQKGSHVILIGLRVSNVSGGCRLSRENGAIQPRPPLHYFCESL